MKNNKENEIIKDQNVEETTETTEPEVKVTVVHEVEEKKNIFAKVKERKEAFEEKHPKAAKAIKVATGIAAGAATTVAITVLAKGRKTESSEPEDDGDTIDWCHYEDVIEYDGSAVDNPDEFENSEEE